MAVTNYERVGKAMEVLRAGLSPFVEREMKSVHKDQARAQAVRLMGGDQMIADKPFDKWDAAALLKLVLQAWEEIFKRTLGRAQRTLVHELVEVRNRWAHQEAFPSNDAYRAVDSVARLLTAISAPEAEEAERMSMELQRIRFDEQVRTEKRKTAEAAVENQATGGLKPWRDVVTPHKDVASGRYQQAEFAADLWQVHLGEGTDEYKDPAEFFQRTYLTESLKRLLAGAIQRLSGKGGDPVVQLQTNFGGGKTHSMLALYHLVSGVPAAKLAGLDSVLAESGLSKLPQAQRVVLVGNKLSPGNPVRKKDGTVVRTLWGELAWQLGGKKAFDRIRQDDERATSPGDVLRELFKEYGPCLVLIDEWVAYARQLHEQTDLPGGSFETQFTFAQALTESAKAAQNCLLVISLPASDEQASPHVQADDTEVGGERGRNALDRLRNVIGRVESSWRPASAEEGFEIVRRRLFEPFTDPGQFKARDTVADAFHDLYRTQQQEFPMECRNADYKKRLQAAYPIHPEVFDRLYTDWSTLVKFQRTRGVLRLMASVIHRLWEKGDRNLLILPSNLPIDDSRVQFELTRYLSDNWVPVLEADVDGPSSLPLRLDRELPNLGKFSACRRVARTIYLGSAPTATAAHRGIEDRRIRLGCVVPGETPAVFGDALRRLSEAATYLYKDGTTYWYSTQPTVTKIAEDRAEQLKRDPDKVVKDIERRVREDLKKEKGDFKGAHPLPQSGQDVPDELDARLVVLGIDHPYSKGDNNAAMNFAKSILASKGTGPRLYANTLVLLAVDKTRLQDLDESVRRYLAWDSIVAETETLNLSAHQTKQAQDQRKAAAEAVDAKLPEAYQWLLVPTQGDPKAAVKWEALRLKGKDGLAARACEELRKNELLRKSLPASLLKMEMDRVPLWRGDHGDHVEIRQLVDDFAKYPYLPRLRDPAVLVESIRSGLALISWSRDSFAYADSYDDAEGRYRGLQAPRSLGTIDPDSPCLLVRPGVAWKQMEAEKTAGSGSAGEGPSDGPAALPPGARSSYAEPAAPEAPAFAPKPKRFHGSVTLEPTRVGRDASKIAEEVITHLAGLVGAQVKVTLEIEAEVPSGVPENVVRTVTENCRTLKFTAPGFESE